MELTILVLMFVAVAGSITWFGYRYYARPATAAAQLSAPLPGQRLVNAAVASGTPKLVHFLQWVGEKVPANPASASLTRRQLLAAGYYSDNALPIYMALRLLITAGCIAATVTYTSFSDWMMLFVYGAWVAAGVLGYLLTGVCLDLAISRHQENLRIALPDTLDLLVVCVEAGLGLDQAMKKVAEELALTHPALCRELSIVGLEMRTGVKRAEAMRNMADRTMEPEVRKFVAIMVQTDRFGTSIADSLRAHAEFMRVRRRQLIEEKANKLGVKLTVIVFFFILPAILIIAGGPAFLTIARDLLPVLRGEK
ncbi:MAG: type II secretion system F family protein [Acidobacteria bacterium]|nr:type II secretion system F family protein [Acidobacteriota bacterium]